MTAEIYRILNKRYKNLLNEVFSIFLIFDKSKAFESIFFFFFY